MDHHLAHDDLGTRATIARRRLCAACASGWLRREVAERAANGAGPVSRVCRQYASRRDGTAASAISAAALKTPVSRVIADPCPWCHRVSITLALRGLLGRGVSCTRLDNDPEKASRGGWCFSQDDPDPLIGASDLKAVYDSCTEGGSYTGRCTAPLLVDLQTGTIISNESADIIRMLNGLDLPPAEAAAESNDQAVDLYPSAKAAAIDETNAWTYELVNNGVYRCGFATKQGAYEKAEADVHAGLRRCDDALAASRFLCGDTVSEADVRLMPTIVRFDGVYAPFFRCGRYQVRSDYPNVRRWSEEMLKLTGPNLFDLDDARTGYYRDLFPLNPGGIVPAGPSPRDLGWPQEAEPVRDASAFAWK